MTTVGLSVSIERQRDAEPSLSVNLRAPPGITALMGPSGSGKSRALAAIAGVLRPTSGRIEVDGALWYDQASGVHRAPHERSVGMVFQSLCLFPHLSVLQNVTYGLPLTLSRHDREMRAHDILASLGVDSLAPRQPASLSGGEAQRVALARALVRRPRVMLLDEPFSALDAKTKRLAIDALTRTLEEHPMIVILVTHDEPDATSLATSSARMEGGSTKETILPVNQR